MVIRQYYPDRVCMANPCVPVPTNNLIRHFSHIEGVNTVTEYCAKNLIAITQEISGRWVPGGRLNHLLRRPSSGWMFGHVEVDTTRRSCLSTKKTYKIRNVEKLHEYFDPASVTQDSFCN